MCVVIDTCTFSDAFSSPPQPAYRPLIEWLTRTDSDGSAAIGGTKYRAEIGMHGQAIRFFARLARAGRTNDVDNVVVDAEENRLVQTGACVSNDQHVIALVRKSGARSVCTEDSGLMTDVKNRTLVNGPRGRVYRTANHAHLLHHDRCCGK